MVVFLIVIVIALVGIYVLGVGMGSGAGKRPTLDGLKSTFASLGKPAQVLCGELSPPSQGPACRCDALGRVAIAPGCQAAVAKALPWKRRTLTLSSPDGARVSVQVSSDGGKTVVRGDLGRSSDFPVPPDGGELSLACAGPPCQVLMALIPR
jgi:hypothetical protein